MESLLQTLHGLLSDKDYIILVEIVPKVLVSALVGGIIGLSREKKGKPAWLKTHILLSVGACVFTVGSLSLKTAGMAPDASRIIAQIVSGIGFLGAGTIFREDNKVYGLTSAAFVWVVSSLGVLVGIGGSFSAVFLALLTVAGMSFMHACETKYLGKNDEK